MKAPAQDFWERAKEALRVARHDLSISPDAAASRAYYAAFYAVSAHFALAETSFTRHAAVEAAVHRDLVRPGTWPQELGRGYSRLTQLRSRGDYGGSRRVSEGEGEEAIQLAAKIVREVAAQHADVFVA